MYTLKWIFIFLLLHGTVFSFSQEVCAFTSFEDQKDGISYRNTWLHQLAETPLQHLGIKLKVHNLNTGFPPPSWEKSCRGIILWHPDKIAAWIPKGQEVKWLEYLRTQVAAGYPLLLLEQPGFSMDLVYNPGPIQNAYKRLLAQMGIQLKSSFTSMIRPQILDGNQCQGEGNLKNYPRRWWNTQYSTQWTPRCFVQDPSQKMSSAPMILTGPRGAWAQSGSLVKQGMSSIGKRDEEWLSWLIDPIRFFEDALQLIHTPKWDISSRLGRRIFYSHVDGDGFLNKSSFKNQAWTTDILRDSILKIYPDYPVSLSFIGAEIDPLIQGQGNSLRRAIELWRLPMVEPSSHTYSHPFVYNEIQKKIYQGSYESYAMNLPNYHINWDFELRGSIQKMDSLAKTLGKQVKLLQWSGNCLPDKNALEILRKNGIYNINGGDSRFDQTFPSLSKVAPLGIKLGQELQVYATNSNETIYSDGWLWQYGGISRVIESWNHTAYPRLIRPINLYYHYYLLERSEGLGALKKIYNWLDQQVLFPILTSDYTALVGNFYHAKIDSISPRVWKLYPKVQLTTLRFDHTLLWPNLKLSSNILGYKKMGRSLYIFLNEAKPSQLTLDNEPNFIPYIENSSAEIKNLSSSHTHWQGELWSWQKPQIQWAGFSAGSWQLKYDCGIHKQKTSLQIKTGQPQNISISPLCKQKWIHLLWEKKS